MKVTEEEKQNYIVNYLRSLEQIELAMEPYKEHKKELRKEFIDNGWLKAEELWSAVKAYRFFKKGGDPSKWNEVYNVIVDKFTVDGEDE